MNRFHEIEFTLREFIVSVILIIAMIAAGVLIATNIHDKTTEANEEYFKAVKVDSPEPFDYALKTSVGNVLAEGTFEAIKPVSNKRLDGEYFYILEIEEHYVQKTRQVSYKCGERTCYRTETYWEWDEWVKKEQHVKEFRFLNRTFKYKQVDFDNESYNSTKDGGINIRYKYYTIPKSFKGSLFGKAKDNNVTNTALYAEQSIKKVMKAKEEGANRDVMIFWVVWVTVIILTAIGFMALENRYLNGKRMLWGRRD